MQSIKDALLKRCSIIDTDSCIEWKGNKDKKGYGRIHFTDKSVKAHRASYCVSNHMEISDIDGLVIMHSCDNPSCVNPKHLSAGSIKDNVMDRFVKGRSAKGEGNSASKLTKEQVDEIREIYKPMCRKFGSSALSQLYGVCHSTILRVVKNQRWKQQ